MPQVRSAHGFGDEQGSQKIRQKLYCEIRAAAQRAHSKLQKPPSTPASGERHDGCRDQHEVAGANCSRHDAGVQFGAAPGGSAAEPRLGGFCQLVRVVRPLPYQPEVESAPKRRRQSETSRSMPTEE